MVRPLRALAVALCAALALAAGTVRAQDGTLTFLHINDLQEVTPVQGHGGFAPLMTLLRAERARNPDAITTLGGDFLSPSLLSGITRGAHMVDLLGAMGTDVAVIGNHEFDFGPEVARARYGESAFPWLATNVTGADGRPFGGAPVTWTRTVGSVTVGVFGVTTPDTADLSSPGPAVRFADPVETARDAVAALRAAGAHVVVALTHQSIAEDRALARAVPGIALILGGHDHEPLTLYEGGTLIHKSGSDAHFLGAIDLEVRTRTTDKGPVTTTVPAGWRMLSTAGVVPDPEIAARVRTHTDRLDAELAGVIGRTATDLDSRRTAVRAGEAAIGNLIADALREALKADAALINGGGIRGDRTYAAGSELTRRDILAELPFGNVGVLVALSGADLLAALEHGVSRVGEMAGRFPQVSGLRFTYDPKAPAGRRVADVTVGDRPLDPAAVYRVATNDFMLKGGDGYTMIAAGGILVDRKDAVLLATTVMDHVASAGTVAPAPEGRIRTR
ncbi:bifunctional metallophosphatase/5'-nucleotidase [Azospirillum halopraeferens]|uniref:bifunctional metallophosphatase/5'-nucleotidase n=1 Tax=Azospirillum halopraeferens TaxID=34010 RepID=UPI00041115C2|nr:5'-nucleotidase C-terminal domain-containing protein [Azospirillum halopraeferens]